MNSSDGPYRGIASLLWADAGVKVASPGGIMPILLNQQAASPALTYQVAGGSGGLTLGASGQNSGPQRRRIQFDAHAWGSGSTAEQAYALRDALRKVLDGFSGTLPNGFVVSAIWLIGEIDFFDSDARSFRAMAEYYVSFNFQDS